MLGAATAGPDIYGLGAGTEPLEGSGFFGVSARLDDTAQAGDTTLSVVEWFGFRAGDLVWLHHVKSDPLDADAFDPLDSSVGTWEFARLESVAAGVLTFDAPLENTFPGGRSHIVAVQEASSWTLTPDDVIDVRAWDEGHGGALIALVNGPVRIDGTLSLTSAGLLGGQTAITDDPACDPADNPDAGVAGEGTTNERTAGTAGFATGGGGGSCLAAGGGGGASAGDGGDGTPSDAPNSLAGLGGIGHGGTPDRILFGSGGGGGQRPTNQSAFGTRGGGIVFIRAAEITGTGAIRVDSLDAAALQGSVEGGGSGGGGGGHIRLRSPGSISGLTLDADGGAGTSGAFPTDGSGGGGGGGVIDVVGAQVDLPSPTVAGGVGAENGTDGVVWIEQTGPVEPPVDTAPPDPVDSRSCGCRTSRAGLTLRWLVEAVGRRR